jgi:hypothetical protein
MTADLLTLVERCEQATVGRFGSYALNRAIGEATGVGGKPGRLHGKDFTVWPNFTASIDAAVTLVPEGHRWCCDTMNGNRVSAFVENGANGKWHDAATPALAICAAALRARAADGAAQ